MTPVPGSRTGKICPCLVWVQVIAVIALSAFVSGSAWSREISGRVDLDAVVMTGHNTTRTVFDGGASELEWPIDVMAPSLGAAVVWGDLGDLEIRVMAEPLGSDNRVMKDFDYLDEAQFQGRLPHDGVDIYSETPVDSKALVVSVGTRVYPLRTRHFSAGLSAGYRYEEYDYRGYNTHQTGYGSWQDQSNWVTGPSTFYSVQYDIYSAGVALKAHVEDTVILTFEALALPLVYSSDEDEHLRRNRVTFTSTTGSGYQTSLRGLFHLSRRWTIGSGCTYTRIETDGDQRQYWYGDDPATPGFDDTGYRLSGIDAQARQENVRFTLGASCVF